MSEVETFDVLVIGGGSGLTAAYYAEQDSRRIALVTNRPDAMGGTCVNFGCIPTKTLIAAARAADAVREAHHFGIHVDTDSIEIDFAGIMSRMRAARATAADGARQWVENSMTLFDSPATFVGEREIETATGQRIRGKQVFIATGSAPMIPPIDGLPGIDYWTNADVLELTECPASLIVVGGGYIGCEMACFFAAMGTQVTLVHSNATLLAEDDEISEHVTEHFDDRVARCHGRAVAVRQYDGMTHVTLRSDAGDESDISAKALLIATGRAPVTQSLGLAHAGIETDERGAIVVDAGMATTAPGVYAYGDVIGRAAFKHTSSSEGEIAYRNAFGGDRQMDYASNPHAVFCRPEVAGVGLREADCHDQGLDYRVSRLAYTDTARGQIEQASDGLAKLIVDDDERILGCHIAGPEASVLIQEVVVAMNTPGAPAACVQRAIHIHPSLSEVVGTLFETL